MVSWVGREIIREVKDSTVTAIEDLFERADRGRYIDRRTDE